MDVSADLAVGQSTPSTTHGWTIYLGSMGDIDGMLVRAVEAGGRVLEGRGGTREGLRPLLPPGTM